MRVVVIGAGVGGLTAAARLAALGHRVLLCEARAEAGGLASGITAGGLPFDGGPYILLDKPGLEWAFDRLGIDIAALDLQPVQQLYEVHSPARRPVRIFSIWNERRASWSWRGRAPGVRMNVSSPRWRHSGAGSRRFSSSRVRRCSSWRVAEPSARPPSC